MGKMFKSIFFTISTLKIAQALDCNLATENVCGTGICLSNGLWLSYDAQPHESVLSNQHDFLDLIEERSQAYACKAGQGTTACICKDSTKYGAACDKTCASGKETEIKADMTGCVCPGTNAGASFKDNTCSPCTDGYYPKDSCNQTCPTTQKR